MKTYVLIIILLVAASPAFAWHTSTHLQMTKDAIALMPPDFQKLFTEHQRFVEAGIKDPDDLIKDWENHYYFAATSRGGALQRIDKLVESSAAKLKSSNSLEAAKQLSYLAHYIGDLWSPENIINASTLPNQSFVRNNTLLVLYNGYQKPLDNIHEYLQKRSEWRWRLENSEGVNSLLYSEAVNDIARVWLTIWQQSGRTVEPQPYQVLEHKKSVVSTNLQQLIQEDDGSTESRASFRYADTPAEQLAHLISLKASSEEMARAKANRISDNPSGANGSVQEPPASLFGDVHPEFTVIDSSLRSLGSESFFVARIRNKSADSLRSVSMVYPGSNAPFAKIEDFKPGEIVEVEAVLPADATRDKIQVIFTRK
jgi:hypothetical protein